MLTLPFRPLYDLWIKFATVPKFFQGWFEQKYNLKFPGHAKDCAISLFTNMHGQRDAGRLNYDLIHKVLLHYEYVRSPVDYGCFSQAFENGIGYVFLSTDDFLGLFPTMEQFDDFTKQLKEYFSIKIQKTQVIHFLNMRITFSDKGISLDQTDSIIDFCRKDWGQVCPYLVSSRKRLRERIKLHPSQHHRLI